VCGRSGFDWFGNSKGIAISYDTEAKTYTIGNHPYAELLSISRYIDALEIVRESFPQVLKDNNPVELNQEQFETFKKKYCSGFAPIGGKQQCELINSFKPPVAAPAPAAAPVAAATADVPSTCQEHIRKKGVPNSLILTKTPSCIAYINHDKFVGLQTLTSKPTYVFENFTIPLHDALITGKLTIVLAKGEPPLFELILDLSGHENPNTPEFISCMKSTLEQCGTVTVTDVQRTGTFFGKDKLTVKGTLELENKGEMFVSNFQTFVTKFAEQYTFCTKPLGQNLENAEELIRLDAGALVISIKGRIRMLDNKMKSDTEYKNLKQEFEKIIRRRMENTKENLDVLNRIHDALKIMKPSTSDELSDRLADLKLD
jgi:hypothetical protein